MDLSKIEVLFNQLAILLDVDEGAAPNAIQDLLIKMYKEATQKYRPVLSALPGVAEKTGNDAAELVTVLLRFVNTIGDDNSLQGELDRLQTRKAKRYFSTLRSYIDAGFNNEQAMQILLTNVAKETNYLNTIAKQLPLPPTEKQKNQQ